MSRTFSFPVTTDLTGDVNDQLPSGLSFTQLRDPDALTPSQRRLYWPQSFDPLTGLYARPDQTITELGLIDPVDTWLRSGGAQGSSPDDFIANLSVSGPPGDPTGEALFTVVDALFRPRFPSFVIPLPDDGQTPGRVATRYGIPFFTGDMLICDWLNRPATGNGAQILLNLAPCDFCDMQKATAAWFQVNSEGPVPPECVPPVVLGVTSVPSPIRAGLGIPVNYVVTIAGIGFESDDVVTIASGPGGVAITNTTFVSPGEWTVDIAVLAGTLAGPLTFSVARAADAGCADTGDTFVVPPA